MGQPYVGEIRMFAGNFAPAGWNFCDGSHLPIAENEVLFNLIGTTYGGDGQSTFAVPDLRGRVPMHFGSNAGQQFVLSQVAGAEQVTLSTAEIPNHTHSFLATTGIGTQTSPSGLMVSQSPQVTLYYEGGTDANMEAAAIGYYGGNQAHNNLMPYQCINFIISLFGIFPSQS